MLVAQNSLGPVCPVPLTVRGIFDSEHWDGVQILSRGIMCNGSLPAGPRGTPPPRLCVPAGVRVLKRIPVRSYNNLERLAPSDGGAEGDVREQYDPEGERNEQGSQLPGLMLDAMLRGVM